jgi:hypothetical protein
MRTAGAPDDESSSSSDSDDTQLPDNRGPEYPSNRGLDPPDRENQDRHAADTARSHGRPDINDINMSFRNLRPREQVERFIVQGTPSGEPPDPVLSRSGFNNRWQHLSTSNSPVSRSDIDELRHDISQLLLQNERLLALHQHSSSSVLTSTSSSYNHGSSPSLRIATPETEEEISNSENSTSDRSGPVSDSSLHTAVQKLDVRETRRLLAAGAATEARNFFDETVLMAVPKGCTGNNGDTAAEIIKELINAGADIKVRDTSSRTLLHHATLYGPLPVVMALLNGGCQINATTVSGITPLHEACYNIEAEPEIVRALIVAGADLDATCVEKRGRPLDYAIYSLHKIEGAIATLNIASGTPEITTLLECCKNFHRVVRKIDVVLRSLQRIQFSLDGHRRMSRSYVFRNLLDVVTDGWSMSQIRRKYRRECMNLMFMSNMDIYQELRQYHLRQPVSEPL